jgi:hypothetical protein
MFWKEPSDAELRAVGRVTLAAAALEAALLTLVEAAEDLSYDDQVRILAKPGEVLKRVRKVATAHDSRVHRDAQRVLAESEDLLRQRNVIVHSVEASQGPDKWGYWNPRTEKLAPLDAAAMNELADEMLSVANDAVIVQSELFFAMGRLADLMRTKRESS